MASRQNGPRRKPRKLQIVPPTDELFAELSRRTHCPPDGEFGPWQQAREALSLVIEGCVADPPAVVPFKEIRGVVESILATWDQRGSWTAYLTECLRRLDGGGPVDLPTTAAGRFNESYGAAMQACAESYFERPAFLPSPIMTVGAEAPNDQPERLIENVDAPDQLVTLKQMAAIVNRSKSAVEKIKKKLPRPQVIGGAGKPSEWRWADVRPILAEHFSRPDLPEIWPADQFRRR